MLAITETAPDDAKKLRITKFGFTCDDHDDSIPEPLPQRGHFMLIVGQPRSGKTNLLLNLIVKRGKYYNCKYDKVFL